MNSALLRIRTIIDKEWVEVFKNRMVLFTTIFMPLFFTVLPLAMVAIMRSTGGMEGDAADMPAQFAAACGNLPMADCMMIYLMNQFLLMYMLTPIIIPITIAAYSIVGEKTTRSLEPLLATPIRTVELLAGKSLAAAIPAVIATWLCFGVFRLALPLVGASPAVLARVFSAPWLIAILVIGPLMAVCAVIFALMVSSRVNDPRAAEQISAVLVVPVMVLLFGQIGGWILIDLRLMVAAAAGLVAIDVGLIYLGARLFQREAILTRWK